MPAFSVDNLLAADRPHQLVKDGVEEDEKSFGTFIDNDAEGSNGIPTPICSNLSLITESDFSQGICPQRRRENNAKKLQDFSSFSKNNIFPSSDDDDEGILTSTNGGEKKQKQQQQQPNCPTTTMFSQHQWAAMVQQCLQLQQAAQIMLANGNGGGVGGGEGRAGGEDFVMGDCQQQQKHQANQHMMAATNQLMLQPPLALAAGTAFPLFQHMQKTKRIRTAFSPAQLVQLEHAFRRSQYLVGSERKQLAKQLMLSETQVKVWFQNRRTKSKRFVVDMDDGGDGAMSPGNCCSSSELMNPTPLSSMEEHGTSSE